MSTPGSATAAPRPSSAPVPRTSTWLASPTPVVPYPIGTTAVPQILAVGRSLNFGGVRGTTLVAHNNGDTWNLGEDAVLMFPYPITPQQYSATIQPVPESGIAVVVPVQADIPMASATNALQLRWNKKPAQLYVIRVIKSGSATPIATLTVRTPESAPPPQRPTVSKRGDPYYFGSHEYDTSYPYGLKLPDSGHMDPRALNMLTAQGVHFIRFGPTPDEVAYHDTGEQSRQHYSFASTDPALGELHAAGITALYVIDAKNAPPWANRNSVGDANPLFETPALYGEYCRGVASHVGNALPWVTRVEIGTNEPNYPYNWKNRQAVADGMPQFADATGAGFAHYAKACYSAIKSVAPALQVVAPGITIGSNAYSAFRFVDNMFANGCRTGVCWDILSIHSYSWFDPGQVYNQSFIDNLYGSGVGPGSFYSYRAIQRRAMQDGDASVPPIMITETGFSSYAGDVRGVDPDEQAFFTSEAFNIYLADPSVRGIVYSDIMNHESPGIFSGISTLGNDGARKAVWFVYRNFATY